MNRFIENKYLIKGENWNVLKKISKTYGCEIITVMEGILCEIISKWDNLNTSIFILDNEKGKRINWNIKNIIENNWQYIFETIEQAEECNLSEYENIKILFSEDKIGNIQINLDNVHSYIEFNEQSKELEITWNINTNVYPNTYKSMQTMLKEFIETYKLKGLDKLFYDLLPSFQMKKRENINNTIKYKKGKLLQEDFFEIANKNPQNVALVWESSEQGRMTYGELRTNILIVAKQLQDAGVGPGDNIAITMNKGYKQIIAALAILSVGGCYVPIGIKLPEKRRNAICLSANINYLITDSDSIKRFEANNSSITILNIDNADRNRMLDSFIAVTLESQAYIIFTSGTSGKPKGVIISHQAAKNTIDDIIEKFEVTSKDRIMGISELDFDLSVFDIFGMLSVGGSIFVLSEEDKKEAVKWAKYIDKYNITIWNSVPAIFEMMLTAYKKDKDIKSLRIALLSGDWIRPKLFELLREKSKLCRFVALGGATEAGIWSNFYEVDHIEEQWSSIPYGTPLSNQYFSIIDQYGRQCPDYVEGEIYIGGRSLATGYINEEKLSMEKFITKDGRRWYCTGDVGKYWENGVIEFCGRKDDQVKIGGFRIELEEISKTLEKYKGVEKAVTLKVSEGSKQYLAAVIIEKNDTNKEYEIEEDLNKEKLRLRIDIQEQRKIVDWFIGRILNITEIFDEKEIISIREICEKYHISGDMSNVIKLWLEWLEKQEYIFIDENEKIYKGAKYFVLANQKMPAEAEKFWERRELYKQILTGNKPELILLEDRMLSPEYMSANDEKIDKGIEFIAKKVTNEINSEKKNIKLAVLGVRMGILSEKLMIKLKGICCKWTFLEYAPSMLEKAEERLKGYEAEKEFLIIKDNYIENRLRHDFDIIINLNTLHTYTNIEQGLFIIRSMLRKGGSVYSLEPRELPPISLITAAILERGYSKYNSINRPTALNPILTGKEWCIKFCEGGFKNVRYSVISETIYDVLEAHGLIQRNILEDKTLINFLECNLPKYMIPEKIIFMYNLPLNKNGKIDVTTLAQIFKNKSIIYEEKFVTETEREVANIWIKILNIRSIGRNQSFFEVGGDSLLATHFITAVKEQYGIEISMKEIFENPILSDVAKRIEKEQIKMSIDDEEMEYGEI